MTIADITTKVRTIMNEAGEEDILHLLSDDTLKLTQYIESAIPDAVNAISRIAPLNYLNASEGDVSITSIDGFGVITLPSDFLRLSALKLKGWKRAVGMIHLFGSEEYNIQHNEYSCSGVNKPVCLFSGGKEIECVPSGEIEYFRYVKAATPESSLDILKPELHYGLCYMCASLVYEIFENIPSAERMRVIAETSLK